MSEKKEGLIKGRREEGKGSFKDIRAVVKTYFWV